MKRKHLNFYLRYINGDWMSPSGLCTARKYGWFSKELFKRISPEEDISDSANMYDIYWGYGKSTTLGVSYYEIAHEFTPLRQNLVLFMAAMAGELKNWEEYVKLQDRIIQSTDIRALQGGAKESRKGWKRVPNLPKRRVSSKLC